MSVIVNPTDQAILTAQSMTASFSSNPICVNNLSTFAIGANWTGTPVGNITLEQSEDSATSLAVPTQWDTISGSSVAAGGVAGSHSWNWTDKVAFNWVRLVYTATSSTGRLNAEFNGR